MMPMTNSQIAAKQKEIDEKFGAKSPTAQHGPIMQSYSVGRYCVAWLADSRVRAEVRDEIGAVIYAGSRDDCLGWAKAKNS